MGSVRRREKRWAVGNFAARLIKHTMNRNVAEAMYRRGRIIKDNENYGWFLLPGIASGESLRDKLMCVLVRAIGYDDMGPDARRVEVVKVPFLTNKIRSNTFSGYVSDNGSDLSNVTYVIDSGGLGINVCQDLEDMNKVVHRVNWGNPCFKNINKDRYLNLRAQAMHQAARAAKDGRLSILASDFVILCWINHREYPKPSLISGVSASHPTVLLKGMECELPRFFRRLFGLSQAASRNDVIFC